MSAFGVDNNGGLKCKICGEYNTKEDVYHALFDSNYHPTKRKIKEHRLKIINKVLNG